MPTGLVICKNFMRELKAVFKRNKVYKPIYGAPSLGSFALQPLPNKPIFWEHCRENFGLKFTENTKGFFFSHLENKAIDVASFLTKFEYVVQSNLNDKKILFSSFRKTCRNNIIWLEPSEFWRSCKMRRSLLTILVRCSFNYSSELDNFDDAIFGNYKENIYIRETKIAFLRFMFGFTRWNSKEHHNLDREDERHGWREEFFNLDYRRARSRLLAPENNFNDANMIGLDTLWSS